MKKVLAKMSGDLKEKESVFQWFAMISKNSLLTICTGGGTQINEAFKKKDWPIVFDQNGRICETFEQGLLAYEILERNKRELENELKVREIKATVVIPAFKDGKNIYHINGDKYLCDCEGYDERHILTLSERVIVKQAHFAKNFPDIMVIGF
jgi:hypothetical protein